MSEILKVIALLGYACANPEVTVLDGLHFRDGSPMDGFYVAYDDEAGPHNAVILRAGLTERQRTRVLLHEIGGHCDFHQRGMVMRPVMEEMQAHQRELELLDAWDATRGQTGLLCYGDCHK